MLSQFIIKENRTGTQAGQEYGDRSSGRGHRGGSAAFQIAPLDLLSLLALL